MHMYILCKHTRPLSTHVDNNLHRLHIVAVVNAAETAGEQSALSSYRSLVHYWITLGAVRAGLGPVEHGFWQRTTSPPQMTCIGVGTH